MDKEIIKQIFKEMLCHILNKDVWEQEKCIKISKRLYKNNLNDGMEQIKKCEDEISHLKDKYKKINNLIKKI